MITVHNKTPQDLYAAIYYRWPKIPFITHVDAQKATPTYYIESQNEQHMERPARWFGADRQLVFVENAQILKDTLTNEQLEKYHSKNVGTFQGVTFYCADSEGVTYGYNVLEWDLIHEPLQIAHNYLINMIPAIADNPYKNAVALVRKSNDLCLEEKAYLSKRLPLVAHALEKLNDNKKISKVPTIALACSGGGYRAMLYTIGALVGAGKDKLTDTLSYVVGLSGSTWALSSWISSGKSIDELHDWIIDNIGLDMQECDEDDCMLIGKTLLTKYCASQPIGFVDIYGACIANDLLDFFSKNKEETHLSDQRTLINDGSLPLPIYTAISGESNDDEKLWYEFTPYEVGAAWLTAYVPTWAFGRKFKNGKSVTDAPEQSLGTLLGTFGLAVGLSLKDFFVQEGIADSLKMPVMKSLIQRVLERYGDDRLISAEYLNFVVGLDETRFNNLPILHLIDAGLNDNLPYAPISGQRPERKADIIIFVDASAGLVGEELRKVELYAQTQNLPFPVIDYTNINKRAVSIFKDKNPQVPIVIYIPRIVDGLLLEEHKNDPAIAPLYDVIKDFNIEQCIVNGACNTFNFSYTPEQAHQLIALGECNMHLAKETIIQAIKEKIAQSKEA
jgi:phospholipase A2